MFSLKPPKPTFKSYLLPLPQVTASDPLISLSVPAERLAGWL
uniref:Uncharacterized protein n=1 Tax=Pavo cristatus TaxID=9049 RepID=A0A8C9FLG9_PAVCR